MYLLVQKHIFKEDERKEKRDWHSEFSMNRCSVRRQLAYQWEHLSGASDAKFTKPCTPKHNTDFMRPLYLQFKRAKMSSL